MLIFNQG